jgi:diaminopimelate epimerase
MHGAGNDYIYVNCFDEVVEDPSKAAIVLSDRHFGIGSDGLVLIYPSDKADFRMDMYNSDGSRAEMCGNAIRCVGKYVYENKMTYEKEITIETLAGIKHLWLYIDGEACSSVKVDMGEPQLKTDLIPVLWGEQNMINRPINILHQDYHITCLSMGNPHAVIFLEDVENLDINKIGPLIEHNDIFPRRTNTEFVKIINRKNLRMRVWERGAGETWACGTGACASLVAGVLNNLCDREATLKLNGGELLIKWDETNNRVYMTGPAVKVFDGEVNI